MFLRTYETHIGVLEDGRRGIVLPDGQRYADGDSCPDGGPTYDLEVYVNEEPLEGDPAEYLVQDGDNVLIRFGEEATELGPNPYFDMFGRMQPEEFDNGVPPEGELIPQDTPDEAPAEDTPAE
jgi:hypothetical protein